MFFIAKVKGDPQRAANPIELMLLRESPLRFPPRVCWSLPAVCCLKLIKGIYTRTNRAKLNQPISKVMVVQLYPKRYLSNLVVKTPPHSLPPPSPFLPPPLPNGSSSLQPPTRPGFVVSAASGGTTRPGAASSFSH